MAVTPRGRSRTASTSASPSKSNGRRQSVRISLDHSDDDDDDVVEQKKPARRGRTSKAEQDFEIVEDDDDGEDQDGQDAEESDEYEVEAIRTHRPLKGAQKWNMEYNIKWKGWDEKDNTWEPETNIPEGLITEYWNTQPSKSQPKKFEQNQKRKFADDDEEEDYDLIEVEDYSDEEASKANGRGKAKNGGRASPTKKSRASAASRRRASSSDEDQDDEEDEEEDEDEKRSKLSDDGKQRALDKVRTRFLAHYMEKDDWEERVAGIINMQRSPDDSSLQSFVQFAENPSWDRAMQSIGMEQEASGKGPRLWIDNNIVNERCPQKVIEFYENHVRFANPRLAH